MNWQPNISWQVAKKRAKLISLIRNFFDTKDVLEVSTPIMSAGTVTDQHLDAFKLLYNQSSKGKPENKYLVTSPEFAIKRLLAAGYGDCYQLGNVFRNEPAGSHHNPEFTMLEWYRIGWNHFQLMDEVAELLQIILHCEVPDKISYQNAFLQTCELDPLDCDSKTLIAYITKHGKYSNWLNYEGKDTLLQFIFTEFIEPTIGKDKPCFVYHFPATQAALAKINIEDERVAERFECYFKGIELVNGFHELTSAEEQLTRFITDNKIRKEQGLEEKAIDYRFIAALQHGLPACAGVALGVDRLIMLALNQQKIRDVLTFDITNA
jgi:lysyl-tRNA synthetase class 2